MIEVLAPDRPMPLWSHLHDLRRRLIRGLAVLAAGCALAYPLTGRLLDWLARPLGQLVFTKPLEAFDARLGLSLYIGAFVTFPILAGEAWLFCAPAISPSARRFFAGALPAAYALFAAGAALALKVVLPPATAFFLGFGGAYLRPLISVEEYVAFAIRLACAFGLAFQTPFIMVALDRLGIASRAALTKKRREVYLLAFIFGAVLTSPEVLTQISFAVPLIILFEIGLLLLRPSKT